MDSSPEGQGQAGEGDRQRFPQGETGHDCPKPLTPTADYSVASCQSQPPTPWLSPAPGFQGRKPQGPGTELGWMFLLCPATEAASPGSAPPGETQGEEQVQEPLSRCGRGAALGTQQDRYAWAVAL